MTLMESPEALSYLHGRGLSTASIDRFRLGVVGPEADAEYQQYVGRLTIPIIKAAGIVAFKYKCIRDQCMADKTVSPWDEHHEGHAKYLSGDSQALYNVAALDNELGFLAMVEGEFDTMIMEQCGIPTVGLPGTSGWSKGKTAWKLLLKDFRKIYIVPDNDSHMEANVGMELAERVKADLPQAEIVELPILTPGKKSDPNLVYCAKGAEFIRGLCGL
ncbi:hypothetical protein [Herbidospora cretacea]|uniref:hypothetical protein n=1 Tax=Herbidospora cretacea TaxID=28444 RepID=UPI00077407AC|nr:hypothetical protein [Herbidospora cretacea]